MKIKLNYSFDLFFFYKNLIVFIILYFVIQKFKQKFFVSKRSLKLFGSSMIKIIAYFHVFFACIKHEILGIVSHNKRSVLCSFLLNIQITCSVFLKKGTIWSKISVSIFDDKFE